jgi:hypothetical protein
LSEWGLSFESAGNIVEGKIAVHAMFMAFADPAKPQDFRAFPLTPIFMGCWRARPKAMYPPRRLR